MRLLFLFTVVALAEMAAFIWVGSIIGFGWALGIAIVTAVLGSILVRRAGISVWGRFRSKVNQGVLPGRELSDGAAILVSGAFLISPGFITDTLGFLLLIPAVRDVIYRNISKRLSGRVKVLTGDRRTIRADWPGGTQEVLQYEILDSDIDKGS
jgi:UPF0716 protein FxsA